MTYNVFQGGLTSHSDGEVLDAKEVNDLTLYGDGGDGFSRRMLSDQVIASSFGDRGVCTTIGRANWRDSGPSPSFTIEKRYVWMVEYDESDDSVSTIDESIVSTTLDYQIGDFEYTHHHNDSDAYYLLVGGGSHSSNDLIRVGGIIYG